MGSLKSAEGVRSQIGTKLKKFEDSTSQAETGLKQKIEEAYVLSKTVESLERAASENNGQLAQARAKTASLESLNDEKSGEVQSLRESFEAQTKELKDSSAELEHAHMGTMAQSNAIDGLRSELENSKTIIEEKVRQVKKLSAINEEQASMIRTSPSCRSQAKEGEKESPLPKEERAYSSVEGSVAEQYEQYDEESVSPETVKKIIKRLEIEIWKIEGERAFAKEFNEDTRLFDPLITSYVKQIRSLESRL